MAFLRTAFLEESGRTLRARFAGTEPLFTADGYAAFADDLLARMVNPHLADTVERASRDPRRKLGWDDRLVGLIRLGLAEGVPTPRYAMGVVAGLEILRQELDAARPDAAGQDTAAGRDTAALLRGCWPDDVDVAEAAAVIEVVGEGCDWLDRWRVGGFSALPAEGAAAT
jgi:mannitol-1-phosphate/altronate dehydrogenase